MRNNIIVFLITVLILLGGCSHKEEKTNIGKNIPKKTGKEDIELKNWIKTLEEKPHKIDITKLKNPFISPEVLKIFSEKKGKIPLELVGILKKGEEKIALLQDNNKKGYIVKEGAKIGNIKILEIGTDYVIIEEEEINIYGEKEINKRALSLKKGRIL
jgi:Tfp pilus assembly protein PilP